MKRLPLVILGLTLTSALAVLILGARLAREEKEIVVEESRLPVTEFTGRFLSKIDELGKLYESHLLDIREKAGQRSDIALASKARNVVGVEQLTFFHRRHRKHSIDLRPFSQREDFSQLPVPRRVGKTTKDDDQGILLELDDYFNEGFGPDFEWVNQPGYPLHLVARVTPEEVLVVRINLQKATEAAEGWLTEWLGPSLEPLSLSDIGIQVVSPSGKTVTAAGTPAVFEESPPSLLIPVSSRFGDWKIASWDKFQTVVRYRQPVLIGAAALAVIIALAGILGYFQQKRAIRLAEQRVSFVNRVSHELRTPLTNILLNIDLAADTLPPDDQAAGRRLGLIREETGRLSRLLENVLTFSHHEKNQTEESSANHRKLRKEPCCLETIVDDLLEQFGASLNRKTLTAEKTAVSPGIRALGDPDALSQIISNLISNVEKYARSGGRFEIEISRDEAGQSAVFTISDHGPGIAGKDASRIFRPFIRLNDSTTEGVSGTGLGLAIARDLAENLNGSLELKNRTDGKAGARFELTLPLAADNIVPLSSASPRKAS